MPVIPFIPAIIGAGAAVGGAAIAARGQTKAAETEAEASDRALQVAKEQYDLQRRDTQPYRASGQGSIGLLSYQLGVPGFEGGPMSQMAPAPTPGAPSVSNLAAPAPDAIPGNPRGVPRIPGHLAAAYGDMQGGQPVMAGNHPDSILMEAPDGKRGPVPANEINRLTSFGFKRVS